MNLTNLVLFLWITSTVGIVIWHFYKRKTDKNYYEQSVWEVKSEEAGWSKTPTYIKILFFIGLAVLIYIMYFRN